MPSAVVFQRPLLSMQYSVIKHVEYSERTKITPIRYGYQMIRLNPITSTMLCKESNSNSIYIYIYIVMKYFSSSSYYKLSGRKQWNIRHEKEGYRWENKQRKYKNFIRANSACDKLRKKCWKGLWYLLGLYVLLSSGLFAKINGFHSP